MKLMKIAGSLATAAALTLAAGSAQAYTVAGVTFDTTDGFDFSAVASVYETTAFAPGQFINGYGRVSELNEKLSFCDSCELTYTFGGFKLEAIDFDAKTFEFSGGWINVYVDAAENFSKYSIATAGDGLLFASFAAIAQPSGSGALLPTTTLLGNLTNTNILTLGGAGNSYLDVVYSGFAGNPETAAMNEGVANSALDSNNAQGQCVATAGAYCPDLYFTSSFAYDKEVFDGTKGAFTHFGSSSLRGNLVPEPGVLVLLGLGLTALGVARRQKKNV